jgi:hypothetical protein
MGCGCNNNVTYSYPPDDKLSEQEPDPDRGQKLPVDVVCGKDEEKVLDRCVKRILCRYFEEPDYASGVGVCKRRRKCDLSSGVEGYLDSAGVCKELCLPGMVFDDGSKECVLLKDPPSCEVRVDNVCRKACTYTWWRSDDTGSPVMESAPGYMGDDGLCAKDDGCPDDIYDFMAGRNGCTVVQGRSCKVLDVNGVTSDGIWMDGLCDTRERNHTGCLISNSAYTGTFSALGDGGRLGDFLKRADIPVPSLDYYVCDSEKDKVLVNFVVWLEKFSNVDNWLDDVLPDWLAALFGSIPAVDVLENSAGLALYAVELGRKNFNKALGALFGAVPGIPSGREAEEIIKFLTDGISDVTGVPVTTLDDTLSDSAKERVLDNVPFAYMALNAAVPVTTPITGLVTALHLLGRKRWDEAFESLLMMGVGKLVGKLLDWLTKDIKASIKFLYGVDLG